MLCVYALTFLVSVAVGLMVPTDAALRRQRAADAAERRAQASAPQDATQPAMQPAPTPVSAQGDVCDEGCAGASPVHPSVADEGCAGASPVHPSVADEAGKACKGKRCAEDEEASTAVPKSDSKYSDDDVETNWTKTSSCRSNASKGKSKAERMRQRAIEYQRKQGGVQKSHEEERAERAVVAGFSSLEEHQKALAEALKQEALGFTKQNKQEFIVQVLKDRDEAFQTMPIDDGMRQPAELWWNGTHCLLCKCACDRFHFETHVDSNNHVRLSLHAAKLDALLGPRPRTPFVGYKLPDHMITLTKEDLRCFWGDIDSLGQIAMNRLQQVGGLTVKTKYTGKGPKTTWVPASLVTSAAPAIVPYQSGSGCYTTERLIYWNCIPESFSEKEDDEIFNASLKEFQKQEQRDNQQWWPVVTWTFKMCPELVSLLGACVASGLPTSCIVQLGELPLSVWWILLASWAE